MRSILLYSKTFWPQMGGLERNTFTIQQTLKSLGYDATIVTETESNQPDDLKVVRTQKSSTLIGLLKKNNFLIVNGGIALRVILLAYLLGKKYVVIYANATLYKQNPKHNFKSIVENKLRGFFAEKALLNICLTHISFNQLDLKNKNKFVLYNPIDTELEKINENLAPNNLDKRPIDCLFVGRIIKGKGIYVLADALKKLNSDGFKYNCTFAGEGKDLEDFQKHCKKLDLNINFVGKVDGLELIELYHQSKILILPSTTHVEGNPLVIAEAINCGTPIICSNQEAMIEVVEDCGLSYKTGDVSHLASQIQSLLENDSLYLKFKNNTLKRRGLFSMKSYTKNWEKILNLISPYIENHL